MPRKQVLLFLFFIGLAFIAFADYKAAQTGLTPAENQEFEDLVDEALIRDQLKIDALEDKISNYSKKVPPSLKLELTKAKLNYELKSQIVKNYLRTSVIQSPKVRSELLSLLNKKSIKIEDLTTLQKIINEEKAKQ